MRARHGHMARPGSLAAGVLLAAAAMAAAGCSSLSSSSGSTQPAAPAGSGNGGDGGASSGAAASAAAAAVKTGTSARGAILTDATGRALYLFEKDTGGKSTASTLRPGQASVAVLVRLAARLRSELSSLTDSWIASMAGWTVSTQASCSSSSKPDSQDALVKSLEMVTMTLRNGVNEGANLLRMSSTSSTVAAGKVGSLAIRPEAAMAWALRPAGPGAGVKLPDGRVGQVGDGFIDEEVVTACREMLGKLADEGLHQAIGMWVVLALAALSQVRRDDARGEQIDLVTGIDILNLDQALSPGTS